MSSKDVKNDLIEAFCAQNMHFAVILYMLNAQMHNFCTVNRYQELIFLLLQGEFIIDAMSTFCYLSRWRNLAQLWKSMGETMIFSFQTQNFSTVYRKKSEMVLFESPRKCSLDSISSLPKQQFFFQAKCELFWNWKKKFPKTKQKTLNFIESKSQLIYLKTIAFYINKGKISQISVPITFSKENIFYKGNYIFFYILIILKKKKHLNYSKRCKVLYFYCLQNRIYMKESLHIC